MKKNLLLTFLLSVATVAVFAQNTPVWKDHTKPVEQRVDDLISKLTLEEKASQLLFNSAEIKRLGIPEYNWWNECLHGVARNGRATVFPQAIGLAATFDRDLIFRVSSAISDEARAKFNIAQAMGNRSQYAGLSFWTPNINIFRDPRWGRGQETYGEDPFLSGYLASAFVEGLQGNHPKYLKAAACAKHYAVHSGPEGERHVFNAKPPRKDFVETYLPAFKKLVQDAKVEAIMCAYNRTYDKACCGSPFLLQEILRDDWGFKGHIVSDCGALSDFHKHHKITKTPAQSAALAIKSGVNVNCGGTYKHLIEAVEKELITEKDLDNVLKPLLTSRFKLGLLDPAGNVPFDTISADVVNCQKHKQLAREAAAKSIVLLKNKNNILPLDKNIRELYVLGHHATDQDVLLANYYGVSSNMVSVLEGLTSKVSVGTSLEYKQGLLLDRKNINPIDWTTGAAADYDATIAVIGISNLIEGEEGESLVSDYKGDRKTIKLPENQINYIKKIRSKSDKPLIVVITGGSAIAIPEIYELADAVLWIWYPGEQGGNAVADIVFGDVNPSGRLPLTFPKSVKQLPPYEDYSMEGRTYKYMTQEPLFPFGFGLSYTTFEYSDIKISDDKIKDDENLTVECIVKNTGKKAGEEVVQLYLTDLEASVRTPLYSLYGVQRVNLKSGEQTTVKFTLTPEMYQLVDNEGNIKIESGDFKVTIAGALPGKRSLELGAAKAVEAVFKVR